MTRLEELLEAVQDWEDVDRSVAGSKALEREATEEWLPKLRELLVRSDDFFVREAVSYPVARLDGVAALPLLLTALNLGRMENLDNTALIATIVQVVKLNPTEAALFLQERELSNSTQDRQDAAWLLEVVGG